MKSNTVKATLIDVFKNNSLHNKLFKELILTKKPEFIDKSSNRKLMGTYDIFIPRSYHVKFDPFISNHMLVIIKEPDFIQFNPSPYEIICDILYNMFKYNSLWTKTNFFKKLFSL